MTASSVDFFPCRVQLMGLPPSTTSIVASNTAARPTISKLHGVSRNLFGAPDPGEMETLYQQETERIRSYVLQRYNFDTKTSKPTNEQESKSIQPTDKTPSSQTTTHEVQPTQLPTLIEQELRKHEQRLHDQKQNLSRPSSETTPTEEKISNHGNRFLKIVRRSNESSSLLSPAVERQKCYSRQSLLKESFNIRKNRELKKKSGQVSNTTTTRLEHNQNSHRNLEILKLSKPFNLQQEPCNDIQNITDKLPICDNFSSQQHAKIEENRNRTIICNDNCTTLSLQLVVSSQNAS